MSYAGTSAGAGSAGLRGARRRAGAIDTVALLSDGATLPLSLVCARLAASDSSAFAGRRRRAGLAVGVSSLLVVGAVTSVKGASPSIARPSSSAALLTTGATSAAFLRERRGFLASG